MKKTLADLLAEDVEALIPPPPANDVVISIDLETLGTNPGYVVLSLGASAHFGGSTDKFQMNIDIDSQVACGMKIDPNTKEWWEGQSMEAWSAATSHPHLPSDVYTAFYCWLKQVSKVTGIWERQFLFVGNGSSFDLGMLQALFSNCCDTRGPWQFWRERDLRTMAEVSGEYPDRSVGTHHVAVVDAVNQGNAYIKGRDRIETALAFCSDIMQTLTLEDLQWSRTNNLAQCVLEMIGLPEDKAEEACTRAFNDPNFADQPLAVSVHQIMSGE